ncbi:MAG: universal stress protein [Desulfamplus sp.]|nr:universal stress protein [Desulfamplus sp.]
MDQKKFRILLAYNGSEFALAAARYISLTFPSQSTEVVIFYVESKIPRSFWQMEKDMDFRFNTPEIRASMVERCKLVNECLDKVKAILIGKGFPEESIKTKIHTKEDGVVRDIVEESRQGYDAVVVGRKGYSRLKDIFIGSVPMKLIGKIKGIPLIIVGGIPTNKNILIAFDGNREILEAIRRISIIINNMEYKILICHASNLSSDDAKIEYYKNDDFFKKSVECFTSAGICEKQLTCEVISGKGDVTDNIIKRAFEGKYESIVIGRRNLTFLEQFFMGRIGEKILHAAGNHVVWVFQ